MSKKDYVLIASVFKEKLELMKEIAETHNYNMVTAITSVIEIAEDLSDAFEDENQAFKKETFLKACGII